MLAQFEQYLVDCIEQGAGDVYCLGRVGAKIFNRFVDAETAMEILDESTIKLALGVYQ